MPKARKKKSPVTGPASTHTSTSSKTTRAVIRRFHVLSKQQASLRNNSSSAATTKQALDQIDEELSRLGGLEAYQNMSAAGQGKERGGGSEKVLIKWLNDMGLARRHSPETKLRLLEVGALRPDNYGTCSTWLECTPIDLHPLHPSIKEQDFLLMDKIDNHEKWDIIGLSLVLNFVPEPQARGNMLKLAYTMLKSEAWLFLVLPLPCVFNSRYLDFDHMQRIMRKVGFVLRKEQWKREGKIIYWLFQKGPPQPANDSNVQDKKVVLRKGRNRNNFTIIV